MQKEPKNIDYLFKSELSGLKTTAPAFVKTNVHKKLFAQKIIFLFSILGIGIISATTLIILNSTPKDLTANNHQNQTSYSASIPNSDSNTKQSTTTTIIQKTKSTHIIKSNNLEDNYNSSAKSQSTSKSTHYSKNKNITPTNQPKTTSNTQDINPTQNKKQTANKNITTNQSTSTTLLTNNTVTNLDKTETQKDDTTENPSQSETNQNEVNLTENYSSEVSPSSQNDEKNEIDTTQINITDTAPASNQVDVPDSSHTNQANDITNSPQSPKQNSFLFSLTGGLNLNKSTYTGNNPNEADLYQTNNTEKTGYSFNFEGNYLWKNKILMGSGLGLSKQGISYNFNQTYQTVNDSSVTTNYIYLYDQQDTLFINPIDSVGVDSTVYFTTTDSVSTPINGNSTAQYLSIPIQFGYVFSFDKMMIGIQAKVRYNVLLNAGGQFYENNTIINFDKSNSIYRQSYFDLALKTDIYYQIFNQLYINGSVKYSPQLTNTFQNLSVERKLQYLHFGLGLSLKL